jgi:Transglutaminase-like superfamily
LLSRATLADLFRVLVVVPYVEWGRKRRGPGPLAARLRQRGAASVARSEERRATLRKLIGAVDARMPGGPNCYRRALLEIGLDAGAAREPLNMGLRPHGGPKSGHAWLGAPEPGIDLYEARFEI